MRVWLTNAIISKSDWISKRCEAAAYIVIVTLMASLSLHAQAATSSELTFDHSIFDSLLHRYIATS